MTTTLIRPELETEVQGLGKVYKTNVPFGQALESLREFGIQNPISSGDLVYARRKEGRNSSLYNNGNYTREGFLYLKNEPVLLALYSPLLNLDLVRQAVEANRNDKYFSTDKRIYEQYRETAENEKNNPPEERSVLILPKRENYKIPTNRFNQEELTLFLFRDQAGHYGNFLKKNKINKMPVLLVDKRYVDSQEESILTQLWLHGLGDRSGFSGDSDLDWDGRVRGVFEKTERSRFANFLHSSTFRGIKKSFE